MASLLFIACHTQRRTNIGFYYWQQVFTLSPGQLTYLENLDTHTLYVKFFDVDWDESARDAVPLAKIHFSTHLPAHIEIIPCVFIANRALKKISKEHIPLLARRITTLLKTLQSAANMSGTRELQIDCDWSLSTKQKYFTLLKQLKNLQPHITLTTTLRLHQITYAHTTGIPPADKGVLMFYNMADLDDIETENSIIDLEKGKDYLVNLQDYPLRIDIALPAFSWAVLLRFDKVTKLIHNVTLDMLEKTAELEQTDSRRFKVKKSFYFRGYYLYKDDILRYEDAEIAVLQQAAEMLRPKIRNQDLNIIFFHLNNYLIEEYSYEELEDIGSRFD
ncbi:MAG: hypothetical protein JW822_06595 [Spirochaetales bacterium]|nr:hypothetical protein [Spirochaetales bacterium]